MSLMGRRQARSNGRCLAAQRHSKPRGAEGDAIVGHDKERRHAGLTFASSPAPRQIVGRGHRRGLDGPSMPRHI